MGYSKETMDNVKNIYNKGWYEQSLPKLNEIEFKYSDNMCAYSDTKEYFNDYVEKLNKMKNVESSLTEDLDKLEEYFLLDDNNDQVKEIRKNIDSENKAIWDSNKKVSEVHKERIDKIFANNEKSNKEYTDIVSKLEV